jgi:hypothetical protein
MTRPPHASATGPAILAHHENLDSPTSHLGVCAADGFQSSAGLIEVAFSERGG